MDRWTASFMVRSRRRRPAWKPLAAFFSRLIRRCRGTAVFTRMEALPVLLPSLLGHPEQALDHPLLLPLVDDGVAQVALAPAGLVRVEVLLPGVVPADLALLRDLEALADAFVRLDLRHGASRSGGTGIPPPPRVRSGAFYGAPATSPRKRPRRPRRGDEPEEATNRRRRLLLRHQASHALALDEGRALHLGDVLEGEGEAVHDPAAHLDVGELPAPEHHVDLDLVPLHEELAGPAELHVEVVLVGLGAEADLLDLHGVGLLPALLLLLLPLVLVLPVIHDLRHGRPGVRGDLHEVEPSLPRHPHRPVGRHDADLLALMVDEANLADADPLVHAGLVRHARSRHLPPW